VARFFDVNRDAEALVVAVDRAALVEFVYREPDVDLLDGIQPDGSLGSW
jgi:hypothetical protein